MGLLKVKCEICGKRMLVSDKKTRSPEYICSRCNV